MPNVVISMFAECFTAVKSCSDSFAFLLRIALQVSPVSMSLLVAQALMKHATIKKPIIVTETGISDRDDSRRELWAKSYLHAVKALLFHGLCICHSDKFDSR